MCWIAVVAAIFCCVTLLSNSANGKIYDRCELARELRDVHEIPEKQIATWVCIAKHESHFNTSANNPHSGDHGIFQISEIFWCSPPGAACGVTCDQLKDDDIEDDVVCIRRIHREHYLISGDGFNAWVVYNLYCKDEHYIRSLVEGCFDEDNLIRGDSVVNVGSETELTTMSEATEKTTTIDEYFKQTSTRQPKMLSFTERESATTTIDNNIIHERPTSTLQPFTFELTTEATTSAWKTTVTNEISTFKETIEATETTSSHKETAKTTKQTSTSDYSFKKYFTSDQSFSTKSIAQNLILSPDPKPATKHSLKQTRKYFPFTHSYKFTTTTAPVPKTRATTKRPKFSFTNRLFPAFRKSSAVTSKPSITTTSIMKQTKSSAYVLSRKLHEIKKVIVDQNKKRTTKTSMFADLDPGRFKNAFRIGEYSFRYSSHGFQMIKTE